MDSVVRNILEGIAIASLFFGVVGFIVIMDSLQVVKRDERVKREFSRMFIWFMVFFIAFFIALDISEKVLHRKIENGGAVVAPFAVFLVQAGMGSVIRYVLMLTGLLREDSYFEGVFRYGGIKAFTICLSTWLLVILVKLNSPDVLFFIPFAVLGAGALTFVLPSHTKNEYQMGNYQQKTVASPLKKEKEEKQQKPLDLFGELRKRIVGQDLALWEIVRTLNASIELSRRGDVKKRKILSIFLLVGPTGVGKTETAKALADVLKGYGYGFTRIDMNQYMDHHAVWSLLGSAKGYIGSDTPGVLPGALAENPARVFLFDEIEKADKSLYTPLLQFFDEGYVIERSTGRAFYANHAIIFITSNLESRRLGELAQEIQDPIELDLRVRQVLEGAYFSPEFLGRIDKIIVYRNLTPAHIMEITRRELLSLGIEPSPSLIEELYVKYGKVAQAYGIRYYLKKIREEVLGV